MFAPLPQADVCVCDYQFHNDTAIDSLDAFKELLNLELTEEDIDISCEISPSKHVGKSKGGLKSHFFNSYFVYTLRNRHYH